MEKFTTEQLPELFAGVASMFAEKKEELCDMDAKMGDGDLGLTMDKGYGALPQLIKENTEPGDIGKTLMKAGMKMAGLVPSTMGTLMSSGVMEGGKALKGKTEFGAEELHLQQVLRREVNVSWVTEPFWILSMQVQRVQQRQQQPERQWKK